jgi:hypothetical protein
MPFLLYPVEASKEDFTTALITPVVTTQVIRTSPQPEPETIDGQTQPPADSVKSALFSAHAVTELLPEQKAEVFELESLNSPPASRRLKTSVPWKPAAVAAISLPSASDARVKSSVTVLRGASAPR